MSGDAAVGSSRSGVARPGLAAPVLAILGPTASGKSTLALEVASARTAAGHPTEIVAVDAFTVYRGMDVGTAKASPEERARVRHHMVDVLEPSEELSVVQFRDLARAAIDDLRARGVTPLLVGGSGLYWRAVVDPLDFPPTDAAVRARIERRWRDDAAGAHEELVRRDPVAAASIPSGNLRRVVRALEVTELTGRPFSAWDDTWGRFESVLPQLEVAYLEPDPQELRRRILDRARGMLEGGLIEEVVRLREGVRSRTARAAIGYGEVEAMLDLHARPSGSSSDPTGSDVGLPHAALEELATTIARRTAVYARRQRSWFRADPRCDVTTPGMVRERWG